MFQDITPRTSFAGAEYLTRRADGLYVVFGPANNTGFRNEATVKPVEADDLSRVLNGRQPQKLHHSYQPGILRQYQEQIIARLGSEWDLYAE